MSDAWDSLSKVYNMNIPDEAKSIIGDVMLSLEQPERTGKWKVIANIECSCCGYMPIFDKTKPLYKFCPNCGAKMEEGD